MDRRPATNPNSQKQWWVPRLARACQQAAGFWGEAQTEEAGVGGQDRAQPFPGEQVPFCSAGHQRHSRGHPTHWTSLLSCATAARPLLCWAPSMWLWGQPAPCGQGSLRTICLTSLTTLLLGENRGYGPGCHSPCLSPGGPPLRVCLLVSWREGTWGGTAMGAHRWGVFSSEGAASSPPPGHSWWGTREVACRNISIYLSC